MSKILSISYIEFYVANANLSAHYYSNIFGFKICAYGDDKTGLKGRISYVIKNGNICFVFTTFLSKDRVFDKYKYTHGDGVYNICFLVDDIYYYYRLLSKDKNYPITSLNRFVHKEIKVKKFGVTVFGDTLHSFVSYDGKVEQDFVPLKNYVTYTNTHPYMENNIKLIDHIALCGPVNFTSIVARFYCTKLGFLQTKAEIIKSSNGTIKISVFTSKDSLIKIPVVEPQENDTTSPLDKFVSYYQLGGVHHIAFLSQNILDTVDLTTRKGIVYTNAPMGYYDKLKHLVSGKGFNDFIQQLAQRNVLFEKTSEGYLLQIFTKPLQSAPTFFIEIIQRNNSKGFGSKNIRALYDSLK